MKKRWLFKLIIVFMCFLLVGCGSSNNEDEEEPKKDENTRVTERAINAFKEFDINIENIGIKYDFIDGFISDDELYVTVYLKNKLTDEERKAEHTAIVNYLKTITSDEKIYITDKDEEYNVEEITASSLWLKAYFYELEHKVYIGSHYEREINGNTYPDSYNIIIRKNLEEVEEELAE